MAGAHHRGPAYTQTAARVRAQAYADPTTRCWRCDRTLAEVRTVKPRATWDAGHVNDGQIGGPLKAECSPCNRGHGAILGNTRRTGLRTTRTW